MVVVLFVVLEGHRSIREAILGLLANAHKLSHLGLSCLVRCSTFSEVNQRRSSKVFSFNRIANLLKAEVEENDKYTKLIKKV